MHTVYNFTAVGENNTVKIKIKDFKNFVLIFARTREKNQKVSEESGVQDCSELYSHMPTFEKLKKFLLDLVFS